MWITKSFTCIWTLTGLRKRWPGITDNSLILLTVCTNASNQTQGLQIKCLTLRIWQPCQSSHILKNSIRNTRKTCSQNWNCDIYISTMRWTSFISSTVIAAAYRVVCIMMSMSQCQRKKKNSKCSNNSYSPNRTSSQSSPFHNQPSWTFKLLHATLKQNDNTSPGFPVILWPWLNIKVNQTGIKLLNLVVSSIIHVWNKSVHKSHDTEQC